MKKAELHEQYLRYRSRYLNGEFFTNEYALHMDEMLSEYFGLEPVATEEAAED
jgi:hypothetical protein